MRSECDGIDEMDLTIACLTVAGCSGENSGGPADTNGPGSGGGAGAVGSGGADGENSVPEPEVVPQITAPEPGVWTALITQNWELEPGGEGYWCRRVTVAEDIWVSSFRAITPVGTHHLTLGKDSGGPDGTFRCGGFSTGGELLFGSGAGAGADATGALSLPQGLAVKLSAGEQLLLNVHAYNTGTEPKLELSGVEMLTVNAAEVEHDVAFVLAGLSGGLEVPPGQSTQTGRCTLPTETTILSVGAHMHTHGVHQRVTAFPTPDAPVVLTDAPYDFQEQGNVWLDPPQVVPAGGYIDVACTYQNETSNTLTFGESTDDEMCYAGLYHYPRFQDGSTCVH